MDDRNPPQREKPEDEQPNNGIGGPVIIPAAAAFVGALVGAVIGSQLG